MNLTRMRHNLTSPPVFAVLTAAALFLIWKLSTPIFIFFGAILFAVVGSAVIDFFHTKIKMPRQASFFLFILLFFLLLTLSLYTLSRPLVMQSEILFTHLDEVISTFQHSIEEILGTLPTDLLNSVVVAFLRNSDFSALLLYQSSIIQAIVALAFIIAIGIFLMYSPSEYLRPLAEFSGNSHKFSSAIHKIQRDLCWWSVGRISSMIVISILTLIGLFFLGVPFSFSLAIMAGLLSFIPNFGPIISTIPAALIAFSISPALSLKVILLYIIVQLIESNLITPLIDKRAVSISTAYQIISQIAFGLLFGFLGLLFAVPITLVIRAFAHSFIGKNGTDIASSR